MSLDKGAHGDPVVGWIHALLPGPRRGPAAAGPPFRRAHVRALAEQGAMDQRWARPPRRPG